MGAFIARGSAVVADAVVYGMGANPLRIDAG